MSVDPWVFFSVKYVRIGAERYRVFKVRNGAAAPAANLDWADRVKPIPKSDKLLFTPFQYVHSPAGIACIRHPRKMFGIYRMGVK